MKKPYILLVLVMVFICSALCSTEAKAATIASGRCGINLTWELDDDGILTISGTGAMGNYSTWDTKKKTPWNNHTTSIKKVIIQPGVENIGDYAFDGCVNLKSITIPDSVLSIGNSVFTYCDSLTGIWVAEGNPNYSSDSVGVLFNKDKTVLIKAPGHISGNYLMPNSVVQIEDNAFYYTCGNLTEIVIPNSVTSIGSCAFLYCESINKVVYCGTPGEWLSISIDIGNDVLNNATLQYHRFENSKCKFCNISEPQNLLASGTCGNNLSWTLDKEGTLIISGIGGMESSPSWRENKDKIKTVIINDGVTSICEGAFSNCDNLVSFTIPDSVTFIGWSVFASCDSLTNVSIPYGLKSIGESMFQNCDNLTSVVLPDSVVTIGTDAFSYCDKLVSISIPDSVTSIRSDAFHDCVNLTTITVGNAVSSIGSSAFKGCSNLTSITLPDGISSIDTGAFSGCYNLWHVLYKGSEQHWNAINIKHTDNQGLLNATIHFDCSGNEIINLANKECAVCLANCTHVYDNDCDAVCNICGDIRNVTHQYSSIFSADEKWHWHTCLLCGYKTEQLAHSPGAAATGATAQTCTTCGYVIQAPLGHTHQYNTDWIKDASDHWHSCTCGKKIDYTAHIYQNGCDTTCYACGYTRTTIHTPGPGATATTDQVCTVCGEVLNKATGENETATSPTEPTTPPTTEPDATITPSTQESTSVLNSEPDKNDEDNTITAWISVVIVVVALCGTAIGIILWKKR